MSNDKSFAILAFEAFCEGSNDEDTSWEDLTRDQRNGWIRAVRVLRDEILDEESGSMFGEDGDE